MVEFGNINVNVDSLVIQPGGTTNVESILSVSSNFNPITFGLSTAATVLLELWKAKEQRRLAERQMALLRRISEQIEELNKKADLILAKLDELPKILIPAFQKIANDSVTMGFMDSSANQIETAIDSHLSAPDDYKMTLDQWTGLKEAFRALCTKEFRPSRQLQLVQFAEFMNFASAGRESGFLAMQLRRAVDRVKQTQIAASQSIADDYVKALNAFAPTLKLFEEPILVNDFDVRGTHVTVFGRGLELTKPNVELGASRAFDDVSLVNAEISDGLIRERWRRAEFQRVLHPPASVPPEWLPTSRSIDDYETMCVSTLQRHLSDLRHKLDVFKTKLCPELRERTARVQELQAIAGALEDCASFDYRTELADSTSHVEWGAVLG